MDNTKAKIEDLEARLEQSQRELDELKQSASAEKGVTIQFENWIVDLFICDSGNLGLTVERNQPGMKFPDDDNPSVDVFVNRDTLAVHSV